MIQLYNKEIAKAIGFVESAILQQIMYWIDVNSSNPDMLINGRVWVFSTIQEWHERDFDFLSISTVKRVFAKLESLGILITDNHNRTGQDRRKWYSVDFDRLNEICGIENIETEEKNEADSKKELEDLFEDEQKQGKGIENNSYNFSDIKQTITTKNNKNFVKMGENKKVSHWLNLSHWKVQNEPLEGSIWTSLLYKEINKEINKYNISSPGIDINIDKVIYSVDEELKRLNLKTPRFYGERERGLIKNKLVYYGLDYIMQAIKNIKHNSYGLNNKGGWEINFYYIFGKGLEKIYNKEFVPFKFEYNKSRSRGEYGQSYNPKNFIYTEKRQTDGMSEEDLRALVGWKAVV